MRRNAIRAHRVRAGIALVVFICAGFPTRSAAENACPRADEAKAEPIRAELVCLLQQYIRIDTTNPPGNEVAAARFLQAVLARDGVASEIIESAPGRGNLYARLAGTEPGNALVLMHHMDVVPADPAEWRHPPLSGAVEDGMLWGRGSLDNKGMGLAGLVAFLLLIREGFAPVHDVVLLAVADEEAGGGQGARWLLANRPELFADVAFVLNEGGAIVARGDRVSYSIELAQKAPLWLRVTAKGQSGHGSRPAPGAATHRLIRALARLEAHAFPLKVLPEVQRVFDTRAEGMPERERQNFRTLAESLEKPDFRERFLANPRQATMVRNSLAVTVLEGSDKENVLPARASAVLDMRLLPGDDPADVTATVEEVMAEPELEVETLLSWRAHTSPGDTRLFRSIEALAAHHHPGAAVVPNFIAGFTDCNAFRAAGITCYGFVPLVLTPADFPGVHGRDERVSIDRLVDATLASKELVEAMQGTKHN